MEATMTQEAEQPGTHTATNDVIPWIPPADGCPKLHHHRLGSGTRDCRNRDVVYQECMKNHAASLGGHTLDGCREFMPSPPATPADPKSLKCDACGCHRNFHRHCSPVDTPLPALPSLPQHTSPNPAPLIDFHTLNSHQQFPPPLVAVVPLAAAAPSRSPSSPFPSPFSFTYNSPVMRLPMGPDTSFDRRTEQKKRFRRKFSPVQKEQMVEFAERFGWRMQRRDLTIVRDFCDKIGVERNVFKVWMHNNNKNTLGKRSGTMSPNGVGGDFTIDGDSGNSRDNAVGRSNKVGGKHFGTKVSSSSS